MKPLQTRRYIKTSGDHEETKWNNKNTHLRQPQKPCFFPVFWPPLGSSKKTLRIFGRQSATQNDRRVQNAHIAEITSFAKHYVFRGLAAAKRSRVHLRPPGGRVFDRQCSTETFFEPLFLRPFLCEFSPKRYYAIKIVVSALFRNAKPSHNLRLWSVHLRPPMRSFAAPWNRAFGD